MKTPQSKYYETLAILSVYYTLRSALGFKVGRLLNILKTCRLCEDFTIQCQISISN